MIEYIRNLFNKKTLEQRLDDAVYVVPERIVKLIDKPSKSDMTEGERKNYVASISDSQKIYQELIKGIIDEHIRFRVRNIGKQELTDMFLGALSMADTIIDRIQLLSDEHEQNIKDSSKSAPEHKDNPLSSGGSIDILN